MAGGNYNFSRTLNTDLGKLMFTSIPHLIILFSIILFIQTNYLYFIDETSHGKGPLFVSLFLSIIFLFIFVYIKIKSIDKYSSLFMFTVLAVFFLTEFFLLEYSSISYLWIFLLLTQILSSYFLLSRKYYLLMMGLIFCVYLLNFLLHSGDEFKMEPLLVIFFTYLISFVFHHDRRKSFINLEKICRSQNEINSRFLQLEENINQIFILCSYDFTEYYYISSGFERMFEISKDLFISRPDAWMDFSHAGDRERVKMELEIARKDRLRREFDFRTDYMNIESKWLKIQIFPIDVTDPSLKDRCAIIIDNITENKMAELKLAEARSLDAEFAARIQKNLLFSNPDLKIQSLEVAAESIPSLS
ncbi:MAG: PAS domain-containing protein, partial [Spirochaetaceae bacterium]|nr:PAS domain-containing protein [Spirochaetaceae bacterium]